MRCRWTGRLTEVFPALLVIAAVAAAAQAGTEAEQDAKKPVKQAPIAIRLVDPSTAAAVTGEPSRPAADKASPSEVKPPAADKARPTAATPPASKESPKASGGQASTAQSTLPSAAVPASKTPNSSPPSNPPTASTVPNKPSTDEPLKPIPAATDSPVEIEAASLKGVSPGLTTEAELIKAWGAAKEVRKQDGVVHHLYSIPPFNRIEVVVTADKVGSVLIRLDKPFPVTTVAQQLDLTKIRHVLILNEMGEVLGQSYPERGVVLAFEPGSQPSKPSTNVVQIILEAVTAEPFVLRGETNIDARPELTRRDCDQALKLQPANARARWLRARVLAVAGEIEKALNDASEAVRIEPENAQYRVTKAQVMGQAGMFAEAIREAEKAVQDASNRPHVKGRAYCLTGDLYASSPTPDYKQALARHADAIRVVDPLSDSPHPAIRLAAKEVLIDAHLGAAHDIAWGNWKEKEKAIARWLDRASILADELIKSDGGSEAYRFHVYHRALAACVGARGAVDPSPWAEDTLRQGRSLISKTQDPIRKSQYQWDLGMALYDALQVCQLRGEHDTAMKYGETAIEFLEQTQQRQSASGTYLLGRLYFRMGSVCALRDHNHQAAVRWFEKAFPMLDKPLPSEAQSDLGRHGETFVSMGVSFWEIGRRERGIDLTQRGVSLMEQASKQGLLDNSSLAVAYTNLSIMHRKMGQLDNATRFESLANEQKKTIQR